MDTVRRKELKVKKRVEQMQGVVSGERRGMVAGQGDVFADDRKGTQSLWAVREKGHNCNGCRNGVQVGFRRSRSMGDLRRKAQA